jgi:hydrogenase/urease accessory protein HupE
MRLAPVFATALVLLLLPGRATGDEFRPAYLQLTERDGATYDVLWKVPAIDERTTLRVRPVFPDGTVERSPRTSQFASGAATQRWRIQIDGGLAGKAIEFEGLANARIDVLVRLVRADGTTQLARLTPLETRFEATASPGAFEVANTYTVLGVEHILLGFDHLLFVLALLILVDGTRRLIWTITAFTVAHSLTLAAASLGVLHVPGPPVEATIALSIMFVAGEIIHARQGRPGLTQRYPWIVSFGFGLLHGLGFAGALAEVGLPENSIPVALLFFNVGVEIGQLIFIASMLAVIAACRWIARGLKLSSPPWLWRVPPYAIGGLANFWIVQRVAAF